MDKRLAEIMQMRAPNQSGVDMQAVARALGGNPALAATPTTYAFGMNVADAQKEAGLGHSAQEQRARQMQDMRDAAMKQDKQLFETAMQANQIYMQERNQALQEKVAKAEIEYKKALTSKNQAEIERLALENDKLENDMIRELEIDRLTFTGPDGQKIPLRVLMGAGNKYLTEILTGQRVGTTAQERLAAKKADIFVQWGIDPTDAFLLGNTRLSNAYANIAKAMDANKRKIMKPEFGGSPNWGTRKGFDSAGKAITVPLTEAEWDVEEFGRQLDNYFAYLRPETRAILKKKGPGLGDLGNTPSEQDPLANIDVNALASALFPSLQ